MGIRIHATADLTTVSHRPAGLWLFASLFIAGGVFTVAACLGMANNAGEQPGWVRLAGVTIGVMAVFGGRYTITQAPASVVEFDRLQGEVRVRHGRAGSPEEERFPLTEVVAVEIVPSKDSDGDPMYRVAIRRATGEQVLMSPVAEHYGPPEVARKLATDLGLPVPAEPTGCRGS